VLRTEEKEMVTEEGMDVISLISFHPLRPIWIRNKSDYMGMVS
jgi:hypothetical protein